MHQADVLTVFDGTSDNTANHDTAYIIIVVQGIDQHLQGSFRIHIGSRNIFDNGAEQRFQVGAFIVHSQFGNALFGRSVHYGEVQLIITGVQFNEQIQNFIHHFFHSLVRTVNLVDDHHGFQMVFQSFPQHVFGLGHRTFVGVYQQQYAVNHVQYPFYFAAEISMARSIQDIDFGAVMHDSGVFGQDGNPTFSFLIVGVHDSFLYPFVGTEYTALFQHSIYQGSLAMVNVSNDGDVT